MGLLLWSLVCFLFFLVFHSFLLTFFFILLNFNIFLIFPMFSRSTTNISNTENYNLNLKINFETSPNILKDRLNKICNSKGMGSWYFLGLYLSDYDLIRIIEENIEDYKPNPGYTYLTTTIISNKITILFEKRGFLLEGVETANKILEEIGELNRKLFEYEKMRDFLKCAEIQKEIEKINNYNSPTEKRTKISESIIFENILPIKNYSISYVKRNMIETNII